MKRTLFTILTIGILTFIAYLIAYAWGFATHRLVNSKAMIHLPPLMNSFKADSAYIEEHSIDADTRRDYSDTSFYAERWRHYFDLDYYPNYQNLTRNLDSLIMLYGWETVKQKGINPWVTAWLVDSLTAQFIRRDYQTARQTASDIGHYVADAHQPLHCTKNYDGQFTGNNGIHSRYETSMMNIYISQITIQKSTPQYITSPLDYIFEYTYHSLSLLDTILQADNYAKTVSGWDGNGSAPESYYSALWNKTERITKDQMQRATVALASLWYTAWVNAMPINFSTQNLQFGQVSIEQTKIESIIVSNPKPIPLEITSVSSNNPRFSVEPSNASIQPFSEKTFYITFSPSDTIQQTGSILFVNNSYTPQINIFISGKGVLPTLLVEYNKRWNLISVPMKVTDSLKTNVFPNATSDAFRFTGNYVPEETLRVGIGYWIKLPSATNQIFKGYRITIDTISLMPGWNLIGSITSPISIKDIIIIGTEVQSPFFEYNNGYIPTEEIYPGKGYWVKVSSEGRMILQSLDRKD